MVGVYFSTPSECMEGFLEVSLARRFRTPEGIARRVPGVWVLSFPTSIFTEKKVPAIHLSLAKSEIIFFCVSRVV